MTAPLKLMWLPGDDVFWDVVNERSLTVLVRGRLSASAKSAVDNWALLYAAAYRQWLEDKSGAVNDPHSFVNQTGLTVVRQAEGSLGLPTYLWLDVDRIITPEYLWKTCPICGESLTVNLDWHHTNRFRCDTCRLVLPACGEEQGG